MPVSIADEIPFEIPDSWEWVRLKDISFSGLGKTLNKSTDIGDVCPYLCSINVYWEGINLNVVKTARFTEEDKQKYKLEKGDLLICEGGEAGRCAIWNDNSTMYYQNALHRVRFYGNISADYFRSIFELYKANGIIKHHLKGETIKHLVQAELYSILFPLPPVPEQERIVSKINELEPLIESYDVAYSKTETLKKKFPDLLKKSILQQAIQGKLVPQNPNDEPADTLLSRIKAEKQRLIREGKIKKDKHESVIFRRDNSHYEKLGAEERCIDDEILFEIPNTWEWTRFDSVIILRSGQDLSPDKYNAQKHGIPYITGASNIVNESIVINRWTEHGRSFANEGDLLISCKGTIGAMAFLEEDIVHIARQIMAIQSFDKIDKYYLKIVVESLVEQLKAKAKSMIPGISREDVLGALIPIPPLFEQQRITTRVNELNTIIENI